MASVPAFIEQAQPFVVLPGECDRSDRDCAWSRDVLGVPAVSSFFEGPCLDRDGTWYLSDLAHGRIFRARPDSSMHLVIDYDGQPNGLALHRDGRLFVADYRRGLLAIGPDGEPRPIVTGYRHEPFRGLSDLVFDNSGTLYFSDQGQSDLRFPVGRVFRWSPESGLTLLMDGIPSPNGLALSPAGDLLYVAVTRANCVYRVPLRSDGSVGKVGIYLHLSGGSGGPDGLAVDRGGGLAVAHYGLGRVWLFDALGLPRGYVETPSGLGTTNVAYGGADGRTLFITEASGAALLRAPAPEAGLRLYSHTS